MKQKTLLLTKAFVALVAMLFSVNAFAQETRAYEYKLVKSADRVFDRWTQKIRIAVRDNSGNKEVENIVPTAGYVEDGASDAKDHATIVASSQTYNSTTGWNEMDVEIIPIINSGNFNDPDTYLLTFPKGTFKTATTQNEKFSIFLPIGEDPEVVYTATQTNTMVEPDLQFSFEVTAAYKDGKQHDMPIEVRARLTDSYPFTATRNAVITANAELLEAGIGSYHSHAFHDLQFKAMPENNVTTLTIPAGTLRTGNNNVIETSVQKEDITVDIKATLLADMKMVNAHEFDAQYNTASETQDAIEVYYVQIQDKDGAPINVKYVSTLKYADGAEVGDAVTSALESAFAAASAPGLAANATGAANHVYPIVTVADAANGILKCEFVKIEAGKIVKTSIDLGSDYLLTFPVKTVETSDDNFINKKKLSLPLIVTVDTDLDFYDTSDEVTKKSELKTGITYENLTYHRTLSNDKVKALSVPFDVEASKASAKGLTIARINTVIEEEGTTKFYFTALKDDEIAYANKPYIIRGSNKVEQTYDIELQNKAITMPVAATPAVVYNATTAIAKNATLDGAWTTSMKNPASGSNYTDIEVRTINDALPGNVTTANWNYATANYYTTTEAEEYNDNLPHAVSTSMKNPSTLVPYTAAECETHNAGLPGAVKAGDIETDAVDGISVACSTTSYIFKFFSHAEAGKVAGKFYALTGNGALKQAEDRELGDWRWYMTLDKKSDVYTPYNYIKVYVDDELVEEGEATAISETIFGEEAKSIFNLNGQKVAAPVKGINIINGKKVLK